MNEDWFDQLTSARKKLERVKSDLVKSKNTDPIITDLLQNLINMINDRIARISEDYGMVKCNDCNYTTQSDQALLIHRKMIHLL